MVVQVKQTAGEAKCLQIFQDLQRLQADFVNYRARVERDRGVERQLAVAEAIRAFLPAMDDLTRAEAHGDLQDGTPMAAIAQKLPELADDAVVLGFNYDTGERYLSVEGFLPA